MSKRTLHYQALILSEVEGSGAVLLGGPPVPAQAGTHGLAFQFDRHSIVLGHLPAQVSANGRWCIREPASSFDFAQDEALSLKVRCNNFRSPGLDPGPRAIKPPREVPGRARDCAGEVEAQNSIVIPAGAQRRAGTQRSCPAPSGSRISACALSGMTSHLPHCQRKLASMAAG